MFAKRSLGHPDLQQALQLAPPPCGFDDQPLAVPPHHGGLGRGHVGRKVNHLMVPITRHPNRLGCVHDQKCTADPRNGQSVDGRGVPNLCRLDLAVQCVALSFQLIECTQKQLRVKVVVSLQLLKRAAQS